MFRSVELVLSRMGFLCLRIRHNKPQVLPFQRDNSVSLSVYTRMDKRQWKNYDEVWCSPVWPTDSLQYHINTRGLYYTIVAVLLYALPLLIMTFAYTAIIMKLRRKQKAMIEMNNNTQKAKNTSRKRVSYTRRITLSDCLDY